MLSIKNLLYSSLILVAILLSGWSTYLAFNKNAASNKEDNGKPDAFMEEVIATIIDKQGKPTVRIVSPKMTHYVENDATDIIKPLLTLYRKSPKPWRLTADHAKTLDGINQILLWENVVINHPGDNLNEKTTLTTPTLTVYPEKQTAMTTDPVMITQPNTKIYAIGMNADLASGAVKLLSETRGEYSVQD